VNQDEIGSLEDVDDYCRGQLQRPRKAARLGAIFGSATSPVLAAEAEGSVIQSNY